MTEDTKLSIQLAIEILRQTLISNHVSIAIESNKDIINFFDTEIYLKEKRYEGINFDINSLVK